MKFQIVEDPALATFLEQRIEEFNLERWEIKSKVPLAIQVTNDEGRILAGGAGKTFGLWFLLDNLWVSEACRGQAVGTRLLAQLERAVRDRGCKYILLDTLGFQARGFYEKHGFVVRWTQEHYPRDGRKFFMTKDL